MESVLVTGGLGFIGSHLCESLIKKYRVITTYQSLNPHSYFFTQGLDKKTIMVNLDVTNYEQVIHTITKFNIDYIFHLAAQPLVEVAYYNPKHTLYTNILGTINILEAVRNFRTKGVIVCSSDKAYGKLDKKYKESDRLQGDHPYEVSKSSADLITQSYFKTYGLPVVITRFGNVYGEGDLNFSRIIPGIMKAKYEGEPIELRSNGKFVRNYVNVNDVVAGCLSIIKRIDLVKGEAFNLSSNETLSVIHLVNKFKIPYIIKDTSKNEIPYQSLDSSKAFKLLGWASKSTIDQTKDRIYKWYKNHESHENH